MELSEFIKRCGTRTAGIVPARPTTRGAAAMAAVRRANRPVQLVVGLPLLLALGGAVSGWVYERASRHYGDQQRVGRFTRPEAVRRAIGLVARVSGAPAGAIEAVRVEAYTNAVMRGLIPGSDEWDISCRTASRGDYVLRIAAESGEPMLVGKTGELGEEGAALVATAGAAPTPDGTNEGNGDLRRQDTVLSRREASLWARRYLSAVGLPLPKDARLVRYFAHEFTYDCGGPNGMRRMLRVRVNPKDGSLEHLTNAIYHRFPRHSRAATAPRQGGESARPGPRVRAVAGMVWRVFRYWLKERS